MDHGPFAQIHHGDVGKGPFLQQLGQGFRQLPSGLSLPQVQMFLGYHSHSSLDFVPLWYSRNLHLSR